MRAKGKIVSWNDERGFGFIHPNNSDKQIFVHIKAFSSRKTPLINQIVTYNLSTDNSGRPCAVKVLRVGEALHKDKGKEDKSAFYISASFIVIVSISVLTNELPFPVLPYYLVLSALTFLWYWKDKVSAKNGNWRTPENTLHLLSLIGGWPGGIIAQHVLRHKSRKQPFRAVFFLTVLLNCAAFVWFHTPKGELVLSSFIKSLL